MKKKDKEFKIVNEIMNDAFWLGYILEMKKGISNSVDNIGRKEILTSFLIFFSSIFAEEAIKANYGSLSGKRNITLKQIEKFRNYNLKYCASLNSGTATEIVEDMGINFDDYVFDLVLYMNDNDLLDINFRNWNYNKEENFELIDGLAASPLKWVEKLMPDVYDILKEKLKDIMKEHIERISKFNINRKTYSSYKLFKYNNISKDEKIYYMG